MSNKSIPKLFDEAKMKMNGYAMFFAYNLMNICVKAEPMSLLAVTVKKDGQELNIEEASTIRLANDRQFAITPNAPEYILPVIEAVKLEHPEFGMEEKVEKNQLTGEDETVLYFTMPEVNDDYYNTSMDYIQMRYDANTTKIELVYTTYTTKITAKMMGADAESIDMAKDKLKELYDTHMDMVNKIRAQKEQELETAYQEYLRQASHQAQQEQDKKDAHGSETVYSMRMSDE